MPKRGGRQPLRAKGSGDYYAVAIWERKESKRLIEKGGSSYRAQLDSDFQEAMRGGD